MIVYLTRILETTRCADGWVEPEPLQGRNERNHGGDIKLVRGLQSSGLHRQVERLIARMPESDSDWLIGQYPLVQHELEISRSIGPGGGAPGAIRGGDDHIGDRQLILGVRIALDHCAFNRHGIAARRSPAPDGHADEQEQPNDHGRRQLR